MSRKKPYIDTFEDDEGWMIIETKDSERTTPQVHRDDEVVDLLEEEDDEYLIPRGGNDEDEECEGEGEGNEQVETEELVLKRVRSKAEKIPSKVQEYVMKVCTFGTTEDTRNEFKRKMEEELRKHTRLYTAACDVCIEGTVKLVQACRSYIDCFNGCVDATKRAIKSYRKLQKFSEQCEEIQARIDGARIKFFESVESQLRDRERTEQEEGSLTLKVLEIFGDIFQIKQLLEDLLTNITKYKKGVKWQRKAVNQIVLASIGSGVLIFGGGASVVFLGVGSIGAVFLTDGLSIPISAALYATAGVGIFSGILACSMAIGSGIFMLAAGGIENISSGVSLKKAKKMKERVLTMRDFAGLQSNNNNNNTDIQQAAPENVCWWGEVIQLVKEVETAQKDRSQAVKDMIAIVDRYREKVDRDDEDDVGGHGNNNNNNSGDGDIEIIDDEEDDDDDEEEEEEMQMQQ